MKSCEYIPLNSWLSNADMLYVDGRLLWLQVSGIGSATILLWLSMEQILKTLVFQARITGGEERFSSDKETFRLFDKWGRAIKHDVSSIVAVFTSYYPNTLKRKDIETLEKLYEFFERRYVDNTSAGISLDLLYEIDRIYFSIRELVSPDLPVAYVDEIALKLKGHMSGYLDSRMNSVHKDNKWFKGRESYRA